MWVLTIIKNTNQNQHAVANHGGHTLGASLLDSPAPQSHGRNTPSVFQGTSADNRQQVNKLIDLNAH